MDYSVAKTIETYSPTVTNDLRFLNDRPSIDFINPGINVQLFSRIVPLPSTRSVNQVKQNIENPSLSSDGSEQSGGGVSTEDVIKHSFQHPRPVKTEILQLFDREATKKRKLNESDNMPRKQKYKHKFSLV